MNPDPTSLWVLQHPLMLGLVFFLGASIGSFLNVVIYRLPRDMRVDKPSRSFCPSCKYQIPFRLNIPILAWFILRGKCANCSEPFSFRYAFVELLTGVFFLIVWWAFVPTGWPVALILCVLMALMISATFIDIDHQIIPFSINLGGLGFGLIAVTIVPEVIGEEIWWKGLLMGVLGAFVGFAIIWNVIQLGKLAFGRAKHEFDEPTAWKVHQPDEDEPPEIILGEDKFEFFEIFNRESDRLRVKCETLLIDGEPRDVGEMTLYHDRVVAGEETIPIDKVKVLEGTTTHAVRSREAMGMGDAWFLAMVGSMLGWQSAVFALLGGSVLGAVIGILQKIIAREKLSRPLPFGPYLALGVVIYMFWGTEIIEWYLGRLRGEA